MVKSWNFLSTRYLRLFVRERKSSNFHRDSIQLDWIDRIFKRKFSCFQRFSLIISVKYRAIIEVVSIEKQRWMIETWIEIDKNLVWIDQNLDLLWPPSITDTIRAIHRFFWFFFGIFVRTVIWKENICWSSEIWFKLKKNLCTQSIRKLYQMVANVFSILRNKLFEWRIVHKAVFCYFTTNKRVWSYLLDGRNYRKVFLFLYLYLCLSFEFQRMAKLK